jgi:hypothetical protein
VSARHQAKRPDRTFRWSSLWRKPARQKKEVFFIGADPKVRSFTGGFAGWDLVLTCSPTPSFPAGASSRGDLINEIPENDRSEPSAAWSRGGRLRVAGTAFVGVVIALPNGRVNRIPQITR